jgi:tRNA A-37 threonylcarbamoyl transferase component Bud32
MRTWNLAPGVIRTSAGEAFASLDDVFSLEGQQITQDSLSDVIRVEIEAKGYYVKRYTGAASNPLRRWLSFPRVRLEWMNLKKFAAWGIPTADLIGYGMESQLGAFVRGALITEEIPGTTDLARLAQRGDARLRDRSWVDAISRQVARITRLLHDHRFAHNDLQWRNLLVSSNEAPQVYLIDCPSGRRWIEPFLGYRIVKDLASLDRLASQHLSKTQRLRFYLYYAGHDRLNASDRKRIRKILRFNRRIRIRHILREFLKRR